MKAHRRLRALRGQLAPSSCPAPLATATVSSTEPEPFMLSVEEERVQELKRRLRNTFFPEQLTDLATGWEYGTELSFLKKVVKYWAESFDWRAAEAKLNGMGMFTLTVDGLRMHFVHQRSPHPGARPLIFNHGWPGSFFEVHKILDGLTRGDPDRAFHVVAPSLPGYGFSQEPRTRGFDTVAVADLHHKLMLALGYTNYYAQGGDWGAIVARNMAVRYPDSCKALHVNMPIAPPPKDFDPKTLSPREQALLAEAQQFAATEHGYQHIQKTKPQSLAYGLTDSPAGLAAWILEKFRAWSDLRPSGELEAAYTLDELLTNVSIYWFSGCIASSVRLYYESMPTMPGTHSHTPAAIGTYCSVPTGVAIFPKEPFATKIRAWVEQTNNLRHWREFERGGHFAALEQPEALMQDLRHFFHAVVPAQGAARH